MKSTVDKIVGLMPLRSGSKSIPNKNVKHFCGKPLFYWSAKAALDSGIFSGGLYIATDSQEYLSLIKAHLPQAIGILRPGETATDTASSESVVKWFLTRVDCDVIAMIQATSPGVTPDDFVNALSLFKKEGADSLLTGTKFNHFIWSKGGEALNYDPNCRPRRQDMEPQFLENGCFYFTKTSLFLKTGNRLGGDISVYEMKNRTFIDIDEPDDWQPAIQKFYRSQQQHQTSHIKVVVVDVDGTLTDGGMYYAADGELLKRFNTRDGAALDRIRAKGVEVVICTGENSPSVLERIKKLKIEHYLFGVKNKKECIDAWLAKNQMNWDNVCFVGDELNDKEVMQLASLSFCPVDAHREIKEIATFVVDIKGGDGVLRDVAEIL